MKSQTKESELSPSQFSLTITKIAVSQVCQSVGFKATQTSALETFTDIAARYLRALAKSAAASASANSAGRTQSSLLDIVHALEELNSVQGFRGASNVKLMLPDSSTLIDIMKFVKYTDEIPFAKPIPRHYFWSRTMGSPPCLGSLKEGSGSGRLSHIPEWLPAFPVGAGGERGEKEDNEGEKWGLVSSRGGERVVEKEGKMELPERRERVRFRMGKGGNGAGDVGFVVDLRSRVCRGVKESFMSKLEW